MDIKDKIKVSHQDLYLMVDSAIKNHTSLTLPCYVSEKELDHNQVRALCFLEAAIAMLNKKGALDKEIVIDYKQANFSSPNE